MPGWYDFVFEILLAGLVAFGYSFPERILATLGFDARLL